MADERTEKQKVQEITDKLEEGLKELFESEKYKTYLSTMSKFHNYSFNNTLLIAMQKPEATLVAGYKAWQKNFERHVNKGEKAIRILAPAPYKIKEERDKLDPVTGEMMFDENGMPQKEQVEVTIPAFRAVSVFDVSQTDGKPIPELVYSWKLEPTDKLPPGKKPCLSLRELEKQVNSDLDRLMNVVDGTMTVCELVDRYLKTKTGVRQSTRTGYVTVQRILAKEPFGQKKIRTVKISDAKLFLIKLQQEDGKSYSSIHTIRGVLRPAFQMAVDDDILVKNSFGFQLAGVVVNDSVTREAIGREQMRKFLKFVHDDVCYCKYYEVVYILFHTGMRISEF